MSQLSYSLIGTISLLVVILTNFMYFMRKTSTRELVAYRLYLISVFVYFVIDILWGIFNAYGMTKLLYIDTVLYHTALVFSVVFCCHYVITFLNLRTWLARIIIWSALILCGCEVMMLFVNFFRPIFFWYDSDGSYQFSFLRIITYGVQIALFSLISIASFIEAMKNKNKVYNRNTTIFFFGLSMTLALVLQSVLPDQPFYAVGIMVSAVIVHIFVHENEMQLQLNKIERLNESIEKARNEAETANKAKTTFLFNMSHDIRTPMNAIIGFRNLLEKYQEDPVRRADYLRKIGDSSNVLLSIINNVLEMARIEKGTMEIVETAWSAEQFYDSLYSVFAEMMRQRSITFNRKLDIQHCYMYCDPIKLREVFFNILSNALKYTRSGGSVDMWLEEIPSEREGYVVYRTTIKDTGIGMSEDFLPHLFEEFSRENNTTENKIEGTGLGMPIVKRLVELMGGTIEVKSKKDVGTTFIVTIPHRLADKADLVELAGIEIDPRVFEGKRILLAEDNDLNAEIALAILSDAGFSVDRAEDGKKAIEMMESADSYYYNIVLMDVQMPVVNGYEAARAIRAMEDTVKSQIPIIAMTANAFEEDKREALRAGMNDHIAKPVDIQMLMHLLAKLLG